MADAQHDLGPTRSLETEAIGAPGQRTFRIRIVTESGSASLWLEKEQVQALAAAVERVLAQRRHDDDPPRKPLPPPLGDFPLNPTFDFHVARLALGYEEKARRLAIYATDAEAPDPEQPTLRASFSREQGRLFAVQTGATVAAGRPMCPLCDSPLEGDPHFCPPSNGHSDDALAWIPEP